MCAIHVENGVMLHYISWTTLEETPPFISLFLYSFIDQFINFDILTKFILPTVQIC